ncbi:MAG: hypothetical protein HWQ38_24050 [Nostoc sp. NMS7]|uniref:hypothetical protein n=1 Tax=Nostoc sp. NMS7 TaxID=2815391 RepID=UPI0025F60DD9|nr:hypothetical protein [Nostoc sp. NMS7]MBN3949366.1 hypothetical protein [Nostoc sp. NMS7]
MSDDFSNLQEKMNFPLGLPGVGKIEKKPPKVTKNKPDPDAKPIPSSEDADK